LLVRELTRGRCLLARLDFGSDIISQILELSKEKGIETGVFEALGALKDAKIAYYDQKTHEYKSIHISGPMELVSCTGNISTREGKPFVHAHAVLADSIGNTTGGHLISGNIFAAELFVLELIGTSLIRSHDSATDLYLWGDE
jgi:predicted DNA-binding protein with PD1-like motif